MSAWQGFLTWIEGSPLGDALRDSGVWTYGVINLFHILGIATLFGSVLALDLRLMGWRRDTSLVGITTVTMPLAIAGFTIAALSGLCMLSVNGSEYAGNPFLPIKFTAIALALVNAIVIGRLPAWRERSARDLAPKEQKQLAVLGGISLVCWLAAISAGRMIGYW